MNSGIPFYILAMIAFFSVYCGKAPESVAYKLVYAKNLILQEAAKEAVRDIPEETRGRVQTNAIYVLSKDESVLEAYGNGFDPEHLQPLWSISKFLLNAVAGMAVRDGKLDLSLPAVGYLPELESKLPKTLTVRHLLYHASGGDWKEGYEWNPFSSDVLAMLYGVGRDDHAAYISTKFFRPGSNVKYSSGDSNLLSAVLNSIYEKEGGFPKVFFERMEIKEYVWETDSRRVPVGSSYAYLMPKDLAKIGELYIHNGFYKGKRIFSETWMRETSGPFPKENALPFPLSYFPIPSMEGHLYSNRKRGTPEIPVFEFLSTDSIFGSGHWGQSLVIDPDRKLVVVRFGNDRLGRFPMRDFIKKILSGISEKGEATQ
ncbi:beta-lactamase [Leptospira fainei serovar Hurstbridge str. BUT 6]|uniref:Beta-lactamase n=1 Tax=Leptospira fainei serovar Hurstbridge str. BUT 6 TaxID=1193011 RepID=S3V951_9LEPT|nr:serine hydrolase [Leptospira fainei]EPG72940.1 beta-lactamase [Leptospira fainei serovar Hurstbridge str. BUT 6]